MQTFVIVIHLMVVLAMIGVVLLQKSEGGGLGMGGGGGGGFLSSRGTANVLTRATAILAAVFFATSLILSILAGFSRNPSTILHNTSAPAGPSRSRHAGNAGRARWRRSAGPTSPAGKYHACAGNSGPRNSGSPGGAAATMIAGAGQPALRFWGSAMRPTNDGLGGKLKKLV